MTDLQTAKDNLFGNTLALCRDGSVITSTKRGIAPMLEFIGGGYDLRGYSAADAVVGKAAAMLFVKAGIKEVFAKTLSKSGKSVLERHGISVTYDVLTEFIINRAKTGMCPMERAVGDTDDIERAYIILKNTVKQTAEH